MNISENMPQQELLSLDEAARFLFVSKSTMYRLLDQGKLRAMKAGKQWRFRKDDLVDYMQRGPAALALSNLSMEVLDAELDFLGEKLTQADVSLEDVDDPSLAGEAGKITQLIHRMVWLLHANHGSDIHLEPLWEDGEVCSQLKLRIDGVLHEIRRFPMALHEPLILEWKQICGLSVDEKSKPQDGNVHIVFSNKQQVLRLSVVPTIYGEKVAARSIPTDIPSLEALGIEDTPLKGWLHRNMGMVLITGSSGSGKSTTMVACARELISPKINVMSIQSPTEYMIPGVTQLKIEGFTRSEAIRAILLQDPDVIITGELPGDAELAQQAVLAAGRGYLVLSTMHANDTIAPLYELAELGIKRSILAANIVGIVNQRLLRKLCNKCKTVVKPAEDVMAQVRAACEAGGYVIPDDAAFYGPTGCNGCHGTGYFGRFALHEYFAFTPELKSAFVGGASQDELARLAREKFPSSFAEGVNRVVKGITSFDEVMRMVPQSESVQ